MDLNLLQLFSQANDAEIFPAGEIIFDQGDASDRMFVILEGQVEVKIGDHVLDILGPGDTLGEMALVDNQPRSASAVAKTECRVAPVDEKRFLFMVQNTPFFALHMLRVLTQRLRTMDNRV